VYKATADHVVPIATALAKAFDDDPVMTYLLPDPATRPKRLAGLFDVLMRRHHIIHGEVLVDDSTAGAALWDPPDKWRIPLREQLLAGPSMIRAMGSRTFTAMRSLADVEKKHPREPHWYLAVLGTEPASQGKGIGSALMQPILDRCDTEGLPAYLESSKEQNIPFYSRHGFEVTGEIRLGKAGPLVWPMWRTPR
jgi:GNAT superfamily N-acetyltransferase